jgi:hypothetical protein
MAEKLPNEATSSTVVVVNQPASAAIGICALIFSIISLFFFAIIFIPLSLILSIIAIIKKQFVWGICAIIVAIVSAWLSPTVWLALGLGSAAMSR